MPAIDIGREIKYRAWDVLRNKMHYLYEEHATIIKGCFSEIYLKREDGQYEWRKISSEQIILLQFTGLHDKNGKEGYEFNIVEDEYKLRYAIHWENCLGMFCISGKTSQGLIVDYPISRLCDMEVIGNIYEDGDLIG